MAYERKYVLGSGAGVSYQRRVITSGDADFTSLKIGGTEIITSARNLKNLADASVPNLKIGATEVISSARNLANLADASVPNLKIGATEVLTSARNLQNLADANLPSLKIDGTEVIDYRRRVKSELKNICVLLATFYPSSNTTYIDISTTLDVVNVAKGYLLMGSISNPLGSACDYKLYARSEGSGLDLTDTNYENILLDVDNASVTGTKANNPTILSGVVSGGTGWDAFEMFLWQEGIGEYPSGFLREQWNEAGSMKARYRTWQHMDGTKMTGLRLTASQANGIGGNTSRISLYGYTVSVYGV